MGHCEDCKHWTPPHGKDHSGAPCTEGICNLVSGGFGKLAHLHYTTEAESNAFLVTLADFGCVDFEAKPR